MAAFIGPSRRRAWLGVIGLLVVGLAAAACAGSAATPQTIYLTPAPSITPQIIYVTPTPAATADATATPTAAPTTAPTPKPTAGPCNATALTVTIKGSGGIYWQGGSGHQMATFELKNNGATACLLKAKGQPLLLNGNDTILILGAAAGSPATLTLAPGGKVHADVQTGNLCDSPAAVAPVRVAFMMPGGTGLVVAAPLSPSDLGGIPPCLGDPSIYTGSIEMQNWTP